MSSFFWSFPWKKILWSFLFQRETLLLTGEFFGQCQDFSFLEAPKISFQNKKFQGRCFFLLYGHHPCSKKFLDSLKSFTPQESFFLQEYFLFLQNPSFQHEAFFFSALCGTFYPERSLMSIHQGKGEGYLSKLSPSAQTSKKDEKKKFSFFAKKIILQEKKISFEGMTFFSLGVKE